MNRDAIDAAMFSNELVGALSNGRRTTDARVRHSTRNSGSRSKRPPHRLAARVKVPTKRDWERERHGVVWRGEPVSLLSQFGFQCRGAISNNDSIT